MSHNVSLDIIPLLLNRISHDENKRTWEIREKSPGERGIFATSDLKAGSLIFIDFPILIGSKGSISCEPMCANCYKKHIVLNTCSKGCGLPSCGIKCEESLSHLSDCERITAWQICTSQSWSFNILRALTPIRALSLSETDKTILNLLKAHNSKKHGFEIDLLKSALDEANIEENDEKLMRMVCSILDVNTFELPIVNNVDGEEQTSLLRGLYPLFAMMNHSCTPNACHTFDTEKRATVRAACDIKKGAEIFTCYTDVKWPTCLRRKHVLESKNFLCTCERCADPTEFGTNISALSCSQNSCDGFFLPNNSLNLESKWSCTICDKQISQKTADDINLALRVFCRNLKSRGPDKVIDFLNNERSGKLEGIMKCNYVIFNLKMFVITNLGYYPDYNCKELSMTDRTLKENCCRDVLNFLNQINSGSSTLRAYILYELQTCLKYSAKPTDVTLREADCYFKEAASILQNDVTAPLEIKNFNLSKIK